MANTDYGAVLLTTCEATSQALNKRLGVSTGFKPSEWAENINLLVKPAEKSASGSVAHFTDGLDMPLVSLSCDVTAWQEGTGTASPSNPRAIHGWSEANVYRTGKNLFNVADTSLIVNGHIDSAGKYTKSSGGTKSILFPCKPNTAYTVSKQAGGRFAIGCFDTIPLVNDIATQYTQDYSASSISFTTDANTHYFVAFIWREASDSVTFDTMVATVQIEYGLTATTFSQYTGTSLNIPFGQTIYGGRLNVMTGELTNSGYKITGTDIGTLYLDSQTETVAVFRFRLDTNNFPEAVANTAISNRFDRSIASGNAGRMVQQANLFYIVVNKSDLASLDEAGIKAWLSSNPTEFVYELATPTTITLTPHQMASLLGENNIWADCGDSAVVYRGMVGDSFKCFFNSQVTSGWTATSAERTMLTITAKGNGSITFGNKGTGKTNCGSNDGYIVIRKNGTDEWKKTLTTNTDIACNDIPKIDFVAGDVITLTFGFTNYHSNINIKLVGDSFTIIGSTQISGISNTTNTTTTIEIAT